MSKEFAQTVSGKRVIWLLAILATFAVVLSAWQSQRAEAAVSGSFGTITDSPDPALQGQEVTFTIPVTTIANTNGNLVVTANLASGFVITSVDCTGIDGFNTDTDGAGADTDDSFTPGGTGTNIGTCGGATVDTPGTGNMVVVATAGATIGLYTHGNVSMTDDDAPTVSASLGTTQVNSAASSNFGADEINALGMSHSVTFTLEPNVVCRSDEANGDANPGDPRACATSDFTLPAGAQNVAVSNVTGNNNQQGSVTVTWTGSQAASGVATILLTNVNSEDDLTDNVDVSADTVGVKTYAEAELRHVNGGTILAQQDVANNVRGHRHTVCTVAVIPITTLAEDLTTTETDVDVADASGLSVGDQIRVGNETMTISAISTNTLTVSRGAGSTTATTHSNGAQVYLMSDAIQIPLTSFTQINVTEGGGHTSINDPDPTFTDPIFFTGDGTNGLNGASCFSWISTEAGDQELTVEYDGDDGVTRTVRWNNGLGGNGALIKQWNVLEDSQITLQSGSSSGAVLGTGIGSADTTSSPTVEITVPATFNPSNSSYQITPIYVTDVFRGSHIMRTGAKWGPGGLWGVDYSVAIATGSCGAITGPTPNPGTTGPTGAINFTVTSDNCGLNDSIYVVITGSEPGPLGSGVGNTVTEVIKINLTTVVPTKQVFLAWAGQRIVLEHDWRIPVGDVDGGSGDNDPDPVSGSTCPFAANDGAWFRVDYVKGSGPGNFLPSLGATINGSDQATVIVDALDVEQDDPEVDSTDSNYDPNGHCISRVLYESEDQGQVDIEAFVSAIHTNTGARPGLSDSGWQDLEGGNNQTKIAFVVYYMKIESVETSLVTSVEKPTHNSSNSLLNDWAPGNPWDVGEDEFATEWNVSKDLLVRVRVKGWFTNSNPSGREQEQKNFTGDWLPANRWVMPDDWAVLAGGEAAIQFRPEYDLMIAPNSGAALALPEYAGTTLVVSGSSLGAPMTATSTTVTLGSAPTATISVGDTISIDAEKMLVVAKASSTSYTVVRGAGAAAHAIGAPVLVQVAATTPFEGPYSLLDTRSLTGPSAALSDYDPNNVRKTMFPDGAINMWDAPMPPAMVAVDIRGAGFIKQVLKQDVYYLGTPNSVITQTYPNPYYIQDIPASPFIPANVAGGGYFWNTWGNDGPGGNGDGVYRFWNPIPSLIATVPGKNWAGVSDASLTSAQTTELAGIRTAYGDNTIGRTLVLYTDNHGEAMVAANGDFKLDYSGCATNPVYGTPHCDTGDVVGSSDIFATADYPDFRGKHPPVQSFSAQVDWTWGGYKDVTVEDGETEQFKYVVLHVKDRDGFCAVPTGAVSLHPVIGENVDFLIDGGQGKIVDSASNGTLSGERGAAEGVKTFSTAANTTLKEFPTLDGSTDECQAWIKVSSSLLDIVNVLVTAHDPEGKVGFDVLIDFTSTFQYQLTFRWSLITWVGADGIAPEAALKGEGANAGGTNIFDKVTAVYGWNQDAQAWLGYFPAAAGLPGVNDLTSLQLGVAYWVAVTENTAWTVITDTN